MPSPKSSRRLIINADDFGFTRGVNEGIADAHRDGILSATTLMANGAAFDHAVELSRLTPTLDTGCHLVLVGGESLARPGRPLPSSAARLSAAVLAGRIDVYAELKAQVQRILSAGIRPTHLDTHKHTHLLPPVLKAVARISRETGIRWVRMPFDAGMDPRLLPAPMLVRGVSRGMRLLRPYFTRILREAGCRTTDHFAGFEWTGRYRAAELAHLIRRLPEGLTEFMCHPGYCTDELRGAPTRLQESRERELEALLSAEAREALRESGVELVGYRHLV